MIYFSSKFCFFTQLAVNQRIIKSYNKRKSNEKFFFCWAEAENFKNYFTFFSIYKISTQLNEVVEAQFPLTQLFKL